MSTATATGAAPASGSKKKLFLIIGIVLVLVIAGAVAALLLLKSKPAPEDDEEFAGDRPAAQAAAAVPKRAPGTPPAYLPLDNFTVNLADRDAERYAQVGITLELTDAKAGDLIKSYMPAVRNRILLAISDRTAAELSTREGKEKLADTVRRETARALGYDVPEPDEVEEEPVRPGQRPRRRAAAPALPIEAVHFSNFIVQ
jgi:flagellar FliL protein